MQDNKNITIHYYLLHICAFIGLFQKLGEVRLAASPKPCRTTLDRRLPSGARPSRALQHSTNGPLSFSGSLRREWVAADEDVRAPLASAEIPIWSRGCLSQPEGVQFLTQIRQASLCFCCFPGVILQRRQVRSIGRIPHQNEFQPRRACASLIQADVAPDGALTRWRDVFYRDFSPTGLIKCLVLRFKF